MASVRFENVSISYGAKQVVKDFSLSVNDGEIMGIIGPSGCGKTTLIRALCGLIKPDKGSIYIADQLVFSDEKRVNIAPERRGIGVVFQDYAVWPHLSVWDNVCYPMKKHKVPKEEIKERYGLKAVRPLADNTMRRIIRGVDKFTIKSGQPYIVPTGYGERKGQAPRVHDIEEPLPTVVGSGKHNLCKPVLVPFTATNTSNSVGAPAGDPVHTVTTAGNQMLVTPYLAECNHAGGGHVADVRGPYKTITAKHTGGIVAPSLIQYHTEQTENVRASGLGAPIPTVDASNRYGLTCANLVKYYSGVVGEKMEEPLPTVTAIDHNAVCAAHVVKFKGDNLGSSPAEPMQTVTAGAGQKKACGGGTFALCDTLLCKAGPDENLYRWPLIRELLNRYCGYKLADDDLLLLSIGGTLYFIADIGLRMLSPRELYNAMGFPPDYIIDRDYMGNPYPKNEQVARCGNAVCPPMAAAVARANFPEYVAKVGDTITTMAALLDMVAV